MDLFAQILETMMVVLFGISWPTSILNSYRARSTKGKSLLFLGLIFSGYCCGIASKLLSHTYNLTFFFYFPNLIMVGTDICLYFRNRRLERAAA